MKSVLLGACLGVTSFFLSLFKNSDHFTVSIRYLLFKVGGLLLAKFGLYCTIGGEDESLNCLLVRLPISIALNVLALLGRDGARNGFCGSMLSL